VKEARLSRKIAQFNGIFLPLEKARERETFSGGEVVLW